MTLLCWLTPSYAITATALTGYEPTLSLFDLEAQRLHRVSPAAIDRAQEIKKLHRYLRLQLGQQQTIWKKHYDKKRSPVPFKVDDLVLLSTKNLHTVRPSKKLDHRWIGPFKILQQVNDNAFRLKLLQHMRIHPVLPATALWRFVERESRDFGQSSADKTTPASFVPPIDTIPTMIVAPRLLEIAAVLDDRQSAQNNKEFLVKWLGKPQTDNSWISLNQAQGDDR
nr:hypothetical protein L203_06257 [Cryptococcus depauperatus CBS 7841]